MSDHDSPDRDDLEAQMESLRISKASGEESAKDLFRQMSHIATLQAYDLIDKMRYWEKQTLALPEEEVSDRLAHMSKFLDELNMAYQTFSDVDP